MISKMVDWMRRKVQGDPYDPNQDPIALMLDEAKEQATKATQESRQSLQQNRLEAAIMHDRLNAQRRQNGRPME